MWEEWEARVTRENCMAFPNNTNIMLGKNREKGSFMMRMSDLIPIRDSLLMAMVLTKGMFGARRTKGS